MDIACGTGQIVIPASHSGVDATGVDIASNLIEQAKERTETEGFSVHFDEGDVESLSDPDANFDVVSNLIGAMFSPRSDRVAAELHRVCKPGGRIVLTKVRLKTLSICSESSLH